ncbi:hypothetical protein BaRGS_00005263 [Batillaria attramentaria]|uniref:Major facilitator superfamily (MFS) profile domain-containing protein n=1 Tax=Batillaria attramentaria TaxID=370345 RepID=A0ABD0LV16_9CAEN
METQGTTNTSFSDGDENLATPTVAGTKPDDVNRQVTEKPEGVDNNPSCETETSSPDGQPPATPRFVYVLTFFTTLGGFLVGYDMGIISGSMLYIQPYFGLSTIWVEAVVSGAIGAAAVSSLMGGWVMDLIGRRMTLLMGSVIFTVGGVVMGAAPIPEVLLVGRIICGLGLGLASVVVPVYMAETSPAHLRGRLTTMWQMLINIGVLLSSLIAAGFSYVPDVGWRYMLGLSALPGVIQFVGFLFMPESPRWLVDKGHVDEARQILIRTRGYSDVTNELKEIEDSVNATKASTKSGLRLLVQVWTTGHVRRALVVGMGLLFFQQWCGINTAIYYSGTVLKMAGFKSRWAVWLAVIPNAGLFLAGISGMFIVDRIGRRPLLIWSMIGVILGLIVIAVGFQLSTEFGATLNTTIVETFDNGSIIQRCHTQYTSCDECVNDIGCGFCYNDAASGSCLPSANEEWSLYGRCNGTSGDQDMKFTYEYCPSDYSWIAALGIALFVFLFSPGMAPMPWTINAEIYPLWARGTFYMFAVISVLGLLFFVWLVPETKGKSLEQVEELFMSPAKLQHKRSVADARQQEDASGGICMTSVKT